MAQYPDMIITRCLWTDDELAVELVPVLNGQSDLTRPTIVNLPAHLIRDIGRGMAQMRDATKQ